MLPVEDRVQTLLLINLAPREQKYLRLLPPAKVIDVFNPELENLLLVVNLDKLKVQQARKIAKVLGIVQKVHGRDQKLAFLINQIKSKSQQAKAKIIEVIRQKPRSLNNVYIYP